MTIPQPSYNVHTICQALGPDHVLDVIDGRKQKTCQMTIDQFATSFSTPKYDFSKQNILNYIKCYSSERVLNCLSLEVSSTPLADVSPNDLNLYCNLNLIFNFIHSRF